MHNIVYQLLWFQIFTVNEDPCDEKNVSGIAQSRRPLQKTVSMDLNSLTHRSSKKEDPDQIDRIGVKWDIDLVLGNTSFLWRCDPYGRYILNFSFLFVKLLKVWPRSKMGQSWASSTRWWWGGDVGAVEEMVTVVSSSNSYNRCKQRKWQKS